MAAIMGAFIDCVSESFRIVTHFRLVMRHGCAILAARDVSVGTSFAMHKAVDGLRVALGLAITRGGRASIAIAVHP